MYELFLVQTSEKLMAIELPLLSNNEAQSELCLSLKADNHRWYNEKIVDT